MTEPTLRTVTTVTMPGTGATNQDHSVVTAHAMAVLDGASSWLPQAPGRNGGWHARALGAALTPRLDQLDRTLPSVVAEAIDEVRNNHQLDDTTSPTSTVSIARWTSGGKLQIYVLGDSPAVFFPVSGEPTVVYDDRLDNVAAQQRSAYRQHLSSGRGYGNAFAELLAVLQREQDACRNREGGYWIAGANPAVAQHAVQITLAADSVDTVLLATDGAAAGVTDYGLLTWSRLRQRIHDEGPTGYLADLHDFENQDPDGQHWPRAKRHDDKTLVVSVQR